MDPDGGWYWEARERPDLDLIHAQHAGLVAALEADGVDVVHVEGQAAPHLSRPIYTRDPLCTVPGGAIIGRMAPAMRRGEEGMVTRAVVAQGMPILRTIHGTGLLEGGSFVKLTPKLAAYGTSFRCNDEGARQLREVLDVLGIELLVMPMGGWSIHIDGHIGMVDVDKALVDVAGLPFWFLERLAAEGIEAIPCPAGRGVGDQLAHAATGTGADVRRLSRVPAKRSNGAGSRSSRSPTMRCRRAAAECTAPPWSWCASPPDRDALRVLDRHRGGPGDSGAGGVGHQLTGGIRRVDHRQLQ